jgi:hypothetical protein
VNVTRPRYRRTRSLDSTDSLERLEARQQYRQQFLAIRAKFNRDQALPSTPKPRAVRSLPPVSQYREYNASSLETANAVLLPVPPTDQTDAFGTLSYTSETSSVPSGDKFDAKTIPLMHEKSRSITPLSEIIQRFTSEMMNSDISSVKLETQSSVKESLDPESSDVTHSSGESTADSFSQSPMVSSTFQANATNQDTLTPVVLAAPLQTPNLPKPTEALDQHSYIESDITLRRPSNFWRHPNSAEPLLQESLVANPGTVVSERAVSLQMPSTYITDTEALETDKDKPVAKLLSVCVTAAPFRPPEWVKVPEVPVANGDQTDAAPSQIPLLPSSTVEMAGSCTQPSSVAQPLLTRSSLFHAYPVTEGSSSDGDFISSLAHLRRQEQRLSDVSRDQNLSSERFARQAIQPEKAPNAVPMTGFATQPSVAQPSLPRASSFHSYTMTEGSTSSRASIPLLPYLRSQEQILSDSRTNQNLSSERFAKQAIQSQKTPNIPLSQQKQIDSVDFISKDESANKHKYSNSRFQSNSPFVRRSGTTSSWTSFPRRSQMPSIPVKALVKKFSANN